MGETIELHYDLLSLPTAQHRAGLAGLVVVVDTMRRRGLDDVPSLRSGVDGKVEVALSRAALTALLNHLYDATLGEILSATLRKRGGETIEPLRTETQRQVNEKTGKESTKTRYVYPQVVPRAPFLEALGMPEPWLKLWRDAVWSTLRGIPRSRGPYEQRSQGLSVAQAEQLWGELSRWLAANRKGRSTSFDLSSSLYIGAQAESAEGVPFKGRPDHNLLLHFWPAVMGVGEVWRLVKDKAGMKEEAAGFALAVPDILDLDGFVADFPGAVAQLDPAVAGYRPRDAVLALPEEGGLQYLRHAASLMAARAGQGQIRFSILGVEVYHLQKQGKTIPVLAVTRVPAQRRLIEEYDAIRGRYRNLLFRAQLIRNLLVERPWYDGFDRVFTPHGHEMFLGRDAREFARDAKRKFATD